MNITIIAALSENNCIGRNGQLPWHLPDDLQYFKQITANRCLLMGRKTYESIGKPLPNRLNLVLSKYAIQVPGCHVVHSLQAAKDYANSQGHSYLVVIGGEQTYRLALPEATSLVITRVHTIVHGDTFFPWDSIKHHFAPQCFQFHPTDDKHKHPFTFFVYRRL